MLIFRFVVWLFSVGMMLLGAGVVSGQATSTGSGQDYPNKPVRMVAGSAPGGGTDFVARLIAPGLSGGLGQQVVVENQGGASGVIAAQIVAKAPPDGYTLLLYSSGMWIAPLMQNVPYDPVRDFAPIILTNSQPNIVVVHPSLPAKSVKEFIALAKSRPGQLNYGSSGTGSSNHLAAELFNYMAGVNIVRITYRSGGPAISDLISGQVQVMFVTAASVAPHVKSGRLRALAVTSAKPSALVPGLLTVAATGLPGYEWGTVHGVFAPARTPAAIINRLNQEMVRVINRADVKERFFNAGVEIVGSSPEELASKMKSEMASMGKVIKDAGIRGE